MTNQSHTELAAQLIDIARRAEALKRECGMDPESPIAIHNAGLMSISYAVRAVAAALESPERVQGEAAWENSEGWESLAWELCADENGEESCNELIWEGGPIPEPWGDRWLKYEDEAKRLIALVHKHVPATPPTAPAQASEGAAPGWTQEEIEEVIACLGDDAAQLRDENPEDERADNMDRAACMVQVFSDALRASSPAEPVPLTDEQIQQAWNAQRSYHGGEPCRLGHLAFARGVLKLAGIVTKESRT